MMAGLGFICSPIIDPRGRETALRPPRVTAHKIYVWFIAAITDLTFSAPVRLPDCPV